MSRPIVCLTDNVEVQLVRPTQFRDLAHVKLEIVSGAGSVRLSPSDCRAIANALFNAARELESLGAPCCGSRNTTFTDEGVCQACGVRR